MPKLPARVRALGVASAAVWIFGVAAVYHLRLALLLRAEFGDQADALLRRIFGGG